MEGGREMLFFDSKEIIQHLFFDCRMTRLVWGVFAITFGFRPPTTTRSMFGHWLKSLPFKLRNKVLIGVAAVCWAI
jgi:hypothetical protein